MAINSRKFPSAGFGADSVTSLKMLSIAAPVMAMMNPVTAVVVALSFNVKKAVIVTSRGSIDVMMPACVAVVYVIAAASKVK